MTRIRTYHELAEIDSDLPSQIAAQADRVSGRLASIGGVTAVMSGKGGVGKSIVTALLATSLAKRGRRVGLLDADLGGPSAARLLGIEPGSLAESSGGIGPAVSGSGVRLMSMALLVEPGRAVRWKDATDAGFAWRGIQERGALREFLSDVEWGELDILLVDLPPGTQRLAELHGLVPDLTGAVAVTIPSSVSGDAVGRSIDLAKSRGLPVIGVIENMSGALCEECGAASSPFAGSAGDDLASGFDVPLLARLPFDPGLGSAASEGTLDGWLDRPGPVAEALLKVADKLARLPRT